MADRRGNSSSSAVGISDGELEVRIERSTSRYQPGDDPVFGRGAEINVDDNPYLHHRLGRFKHQQGWWWLQNLGSSTVLLTLDPMSGAASRVPPGTQVVLAHTCEIIRFEVGRTHYEIEVEQDPRSLSSVAFEQSDLSDVTIDITEVAINEDQRRMLIALCEAHLRNPLGALQLPSNREIADQLGWSLTKLNRKLDWLCDRMAREGVSGMKEVDGRATRRRERLVEHAINSGLIGIDDLTQTASST